jgi:hypothetical protein
MKATLEFNLPEEQAEHSYAVAGVDALLVIDDLLNEIRSKLKYDSGRFKEWNAEVYNEETQSFESKKVQGCDHTLEQVRDILLELKNERRLPELI